VPKFWVSRRRPASTYLNYRADGEEWLPTRDSPLPQHLGRVRRDSPPAQLCEPVDSGLGSCGPACAIEGLQYDVDHLAVVTNAQPHEDRIELSNREGDAVMLDLVHATSLNSALLISHFDPTAGSEVDISLDGRVRAAAQRAGDAVQHNGSPVIS
jgi:hypothetical protein